MKIKPRNQWVLIKEIEPKEKIGGVYLPSSVEKDRKAQGIVIELGDKVVGLKKKDNVLFGTYAGEEVKIDDDKAKYRLVEDEDILAILE